MIFSNNVTIPGQAPLPKSPNQREGESYMAMQLRMLNEKWAEEESPIRVIKENP